MRYLAILDGNEHEIEIEELAADSFSIRFGENSFEADLRRVGPVSFSVIVNNRYLSSPSPIPKFDNPKMHMNPALQLFGAGRERRIHAIPPYTPVRSLDFDDHPFEVQKWQHACALCRSTESFLDEMIVDDAGTRMFVCSDSDYCHERRGDQDLELPAYEARKGETA